MKILKKIVVIIIVLLIFISLLFCISTLAYQRLVDEGSVIEDNQCLKVNPFLIQRRNSYINTIKIAQANGSETEYWNEQKRYLDISKKYIQVEQEWLLIQQKFMSRWDYNLILPSEVKIGERAKYISRESEMKSTIAVVETFNSPNNIKRQKELYQVIVAETKKKNEADAEINRVWETRPKFDLRMRFIKFAISKCPKENWNIPNVSDFLSPPKPIQSGPVTYNFKTTSGVWRSKQTI